MREKKEPNKDKKTYKSAKSRMKEKHKVIYTIGSVGLTVVSVVLMPKIIQKLSDNLDV